MRLFLLPLIIGFALPANASPIHLSCSGSTIDETGTWDVTINPRSDKGVVSEITKYGKVWTTKKLPQFISSNTYTLQEIESKSFATLNTTYEVDRVNGDFVKTFWMTNTVETMF